MMLLNTFRSLAIVSVCSLSLAAIATRGSAATITLSANRDNLIMETAYSADTPPQQLNDVNLGGVAYTQIGTAGGNDAGGRARFLIGFDNTPLPAFDQINSVTLRLYHWNFSGVSNLTNSTPFTLEVHAITSANADWVEGTGVGGVTPANDSGSNWNRKSEPGSLNWAGGTGMPATGGLTSPGLDYEVTALASYTFNSIPADGAPIDFIFTGSTAALTALIDGWDTTNPGFLIFHTTPTDPAGNRRLFFHTREVTDLNLRPQLIVDFDPIVPAPEPASIVLLGLGLVMLAKRRRK